MKRNIFSYTGFAGVLLLLAPWSFSWRRWVWCRYLPWAEASPIWGFVRQFSLLVRHPRLWWFCRRLDMHFAWGFPIPKTDTERGRLRV